jgi:hypothetical protein
MSDYKSILKKGVVFSSTITRSAFICSGTKAYHSNFPPHYVSELPKPSLLFILNINSYCYG